MNFSSKKKLILFFLYEYLYESVFFVYHFFVLHNSKTRNQNSCTKSKVNIVARKNYTYTYLLYINK